MRKELVGALERRRRLGVIASLRLLAPSLRYTEIACVLTVLRET